MGLYSQVAISLESILADEPVRWTSHFSVRIMRSTKGFQPDFLKVQNDGFDHLDHQESLLIINLAAA